MPAAAGSTPDGKPLGFGLQTSEKTYQSYYFRVRDRGGHSSRPRPDNAIHWERMVRELAR